MASTSTLGPEHIGTAELARKVGRCRRTIQLWAALGKLPEPTRKPGRRRLAWRREVIAEWLARGWAAG
jgi:hypothetical protein